MPRIDAHTVAEHRARKERAILSATVDLLVNEGDDAVTPAAVAKRSGIARTSVYQYHGSTAELIAAAVMELFRRAEAEMDAALSAAGDDPEERLRAYVTTTLQLARDGHAPARPAALAGAPAECRAAVRECHQRLMAPLAAIVDGLGASEVGTTAALAAGSLQAASQLVEHGADLSEVADVTCTFIARAVRP